MSGHAFASRIVKRSFVAAVVGTQRMRLRPTVVCASRPPSVSLISRHSPSTDVLAGDDAVERRGLGELDRQRRSRDAVVRRPVGLGIAVHGLRRAIRGVVAAHVVRRRLRAACEVFLERLLDGLRQRACLVCLLYRHCRSPLLSVFGCVLPAGLSRSRNDTMMP